MSIEFSTIAFAPVHEGKFEFTPFPSALPKRNALLADLYEDDEAVFRRKIIESIDQGKPLIALGVVGPPEACIITGYDENGDGLRGFGVFQTNRLVQETVRVNRAEGQGRCRLG